MRPQEIKDRVDAITLGAIAAARRAKEQYEASHAAEREALVAECEKNGHLFVRDGFFATASSCVCCRAPKPVEALPGNLMTKAA